MNITPLDEAIAYVIELQGQLDSGPWNSYNIWNHECRSAQEALNAIRKLQNAMAITKQEVDECNHGAETGLSGNWPPDQWESSYRALEALRPPGYAEVAGCDDKQLAEARRHYDEMVLVMDPPRQPEHICWDCRKPCFEVTNVSGLLVGECCVNAYTLD